MADPRAEHRVIREWLPHDLDALATKGHGDGVPPDASFCCWGSLALEWPIHAGYMHATMTKERAEHHFARYTKYFDDCYESFHQAISDGNADLACRAILRVGPAYWDFSSVWELCLLDCVKLFLIKAIYSTSDRRVWSACFELAKEPIIQSKYSHDKKILPHPTFITAFPPGHIPDPINTRMQDERMAFAIDAVDLSSYKDEWAAMWEHRDHFHYGYKNRPLTLAAIKRKVFPEENA